MEILLNKLQIIGETHIENIINERLSEFSSFKDKSEKEWFSELCFCILTANAKQKTAAEIQSQIGSHGFLNLSQETLSNLIKINKHRFHNNKAKYIIEARKFQNIKDIISKKTEKNAREFLVKNIKGLGYKEASHFLRNTGSQNLAILDRHVLKLLKEHNFIEIPTSLTPKNYKKIELKCKNLASKLRISLAKLDLMMWYLKTGEVLK